MKAAAAPAGDAGQAGGGRARRTRRWAAAWRSRSPATARIVAGRSRRSSIGQPEVKIGLLPGGGGTRARCAVLRHRAGAAHLITEGKDIEPAAGAEHGPAQRPGARPRRPPARRRAPGSPHNPSAQAAVGRAGIPACRAATARSTRRGAAAGHRALAGLARDDCGNYPAPVRHIIERHLRRRPASTSRPPSAVEAAYFAACCDVAGRAAT
jgi:enoyl-CoA hydratase/carnithine racemase